MKEKKPIPVTNMMRGVIMALDVQLNLRTILPEMKSDVIVAKIPIPVRICPI